MTKAGGVRQSEPATPDLDAACAALGLDLTGEQRAKLLRFVDLLQRWNATYNLTSIRDPAEILSRHVFDCLAIVLLLQRRSTDSQPMRILDVGSGAGLPGLVLAVANPRFEVVCVDAVGKKAAFVRQAAGELGLKNLTSLHARVEDIRDELGFDLIVSRAFAKLAEFVRVTAPLLKSSGAWLAMKGKRPTEELSALTKPVQVFHVEQLTVPYLNAERCVVWMQPESDPR